MKRPASTLGMRHVALYVYRLNACVDFYCNILGMRIEWQPDSDNVYLTSGHDNLALHRAKQQRSAEHEQVLDHIGFIIASMAQVDAWFEFMQHQQIEIRTPPRVHRDGAKSFYCYDPDGNVVQMMYHPPLVPGDTVEA